MLTEVEEREEKRVVSLQPAQTKKPKKSVKEINMSCINDKDVTTIRIGPCLDAI